MSITYISLDRKVRPYLVLFLIVSLSSFSFIQYSSSQFYNPSTLSSDPKQQLVTYERQSDFIHEFQVPMLKEQGLKGITTDSQGNVWFYHSTNHSSMIIKLDVKNNSFKSYPIEGETVTDNAVINLAGGQMIFDKTSDVIWFTDARINSIASFELTSGKMEIYKIPTNNSGIMGIKMSTDRKNIWFTEIIGNKIGNLDIDSKNITEYPTGDSTGPTLLTMDSKGVLWVTLSYANSVLRIEPWLLIPSTRASGMSTITLNKPDVFSPFGIAITKDKDNNEKLFVSDHGSSRVIVADLDSDLKNYTSYWTSPSRAVPMSLPSQVVADSSGNIYFPEHGGNKISKIAAETGIMTEFDIPTGPLATTVFLTVTGDNNRVWFTEWASNKIGYLDNTQQIPLNLGVRDSATAQTSYIYKPVILKEDESLTLDVVVSSSYQNSSLPLVMNETELSVIGMTDSGLRGISYRANPQRVNLVNQPVATASIGIKVDRFGAIDGIYTVMVRASGLEKDHLIVSLLYPQVIKLDVPVKASQLQKSLNFQQGSSSDNSSPLFESLLRDLARILSIAVVIALMGYLLYRKIRRTKLKTDRTT